MVGLSPDRGFQAIREMIARGDVMTDRKIEPWWASARERPLVRVGRLVTDGNKVALRRGTLRQNHSATVFSAINIRHDDCPAGRKRDRGGGNNPFGGDLAEFDAFRRAGTLQPQPNLGGIARG